ncbi:polysaccharide deacetylase family protein [Clostridium grantii]|uniref:Peptidoglycan/xylan/chitin deacetylase, PgdA/CDA1 family n=1 Tax=Clostridium grantii DSM 8605 TaxID=1121316 RepID=A0A1M5XIW8_9CLOT|nr:polysaccharide deacetylase family protein [Clostridium grantii]SHH99498.1 Peptidoglycan/xylan/chitin deacetylase, PgdA/CDA1 family [Clostridium grantii DSM 8605]
MNNKRIPHTKTLNFFLMASFLVMSVLLSGCARNTPENNNNNSTTLIEEDKSSQPTENSTKNETPSEIKEDANNSTDNDTVADPEKIAYLTFDDGPSTEVTPEILKVLDEYNVKATFFVLGLKAERFPELVLQEHNNGHIVANHTYGHDEEYLYANPDNFMKDIHKAEDVLKEIIPGYDYKLIRFPQGAFQKSKAAHREVVSAAGYHYVDWNCINGDYLANTLETDKILEQIKETYNNQKKLIVLMHDATPKTTTAEALPAVIEFLQQEGYTFKTLEALTK